MKQVKRIVVMVVGGTVLGIPLRKRLVLSSANYNGRSAAALGVAAHECGHAIQHKMAYGQMPY